MVGTKGGVDRTRYLSLACWRFSSIKHLLPALHPRHGLHILTPVTHFHGALLQGDTGLGVPATQGRTQREIERGIPDAACVQAAMCVHVRERVCTEVCLHTGLHTYAGVAKSVQTCAMYECVGGCMYGGVFIHV